MEVNTLCDPIQQAILTKVEGGNMQIFNFIFVKNRIIIRQKDCFQGMNTTDEKKYLEKLKLGDIKAFDILFLQYHPRVVSFLKGFIQNEEEALDMAQDIFIKIWINRLSLDIRSLKAYLFQMARNMVYDYYRKNTCYHEYESYEKLTLLSDSPEEDIYAKELSLLIDISIDNMPEQRKRIFKMSRFKGLSNDEIAQNLKISKRTVENHITQALADLRKIILSIMFFF